MPVSVQMCISPTTKDEEHSMCQNSTRVIFNIIIFILITIVIPLSGLALCLGLFLCMLMIKTCNVELQWNFGDCWVVILTENCTALPHRDWLAACIFRILWHLVVLHSCQAYLPSNWVGRGLVRSFTGSACEACFAAMKMSIRKCVSCYFIMFLLLV